MRRRKQKKRPAKAGQRRPERGRRLTKAAAVLAALALVAAALAGGLAFRGVLSGGGPPGPPAAAIVDQLSLTVPNPAFAEEATETLERAGHAVDYYPGEQVTVDFYRNLPARDYDLVILRVHSGIVVEHDVTTGQETVTEYVSLFSGEPYSKSKYPPRERIGRLGEAFYYEGGEAYFGILPGFVEDSMEGRFDNTLILMMGCDGLRSTRMAQAFLDKGASAFVSWSETVSASHTDAATQRLLEKLFVEGLTVGDAVSQTAAEVGPDPFYESELRILSREG